jgi:hypothetical protein
MSLFNQRDVAVSTRGPVPTDYLYKSTIEAA